MTSETRNSLLSTCEDLLVKLHTLKTQKPMVAGLEKLISLTAAEQKFLATADTKTISSNLPFITSLVNTFESESDVISVLRKLNQESLKVDIISCGGFKWIKVANYKALNREITQFLADFMDDLDSEWELALSEIGFMKHIDQLLKAAVLNKLHFQVPRVVLRLNLPSKDVTVHPKVFEYTHKLGVDVEIQVGSEIILHSALTEQVMNVLPSLLHPCINFDVTTLVALCSDLTHTKSFPSSVHEIPALKAQIEDEKNSPFFEHVNPYLENASRLVCSERTFKKFFDVLDQVAGLEEKNRAFSLFHPETLAKYQVHVGKSPMILNTFIEVIETEGSDLHATIKNIANRFQAMTLTANKKLAAELNSVYLHKPRSFIGNR